MAKSNSVWGIDIGQCALKALRCTRDGDRVVVDAFDYIEYPKILSQPDEADPKQLVREALEQFLSRNEVKGHRVAISVPGQAGLARFFKPPPVDAKKIPDIVKYEARQQIPFALEDVIWDYQMLGGSEVDGFAIDAEVGLFAMKREQVFKAIEPFSNADVELDIVQLSPLSIFNFVTYDLLRDRGTSYDPDNPPPSLVVLALGTETTDLVVTNGFRVWQRSIPLGGNHFTKQLTKELKLTFAKAEHLKRNARQAEDPKRVFQAMRPVFNDLVTEVQRSVSYFQNIDRKAKIQGVVLLGNTVKLPGLQPYLAKNLGFEIVNFEQYHRLDESGVSSSPAYQENQLAFGVCYGLCLQGLGVAKLNTNLIPREIVTERLVRAKKPWIIACVASLLLACSFNFFFNYSVWYRVQPDYARNGVKWKDAESGIDSVKTTSDSYKSADAERIGKKKLLERIGDEVVGNADRRILWLELITALNQGLPETPGIVPNTVADPKQFPFDQRRELYITSIDNIYLEDVSTWFTDAVKRRYQGGINVIQGGAPQAAPAQGEEGADTAATPTDTAAPELVPPKGEGWIVEIQGYHLYNSERNATTSGPYHVNDTLVRFLEYGDVNLPNPKAGVVDRFTMKELGVSYPVLVADQPIDFSHTVPNPNFIGQSSSGAGASQGSGFSGPPSGGAASGPMGAGAIPGAAGGASGAIPGQAATGTGSSNAPRQNSDGVQIDENGEPEVYPAPRYDFAVQFVWQPKLLTKRLQEREEALKKAQEAAAQGQTGDAAAAVPGTGTTTTQALPTNPVQPATNLPGTGPANAATGPANTNVPAGTVPAQVVPADTVPGDTVPADAVPADTLPEETDPAAEIPGGNVPGANNEVVPGPGTEPGVVPGDGTDVTDEDVTNPMN